MQGNSNIEQSIARKGLRDALKDEEFYFQYQKTSNLWIPICRIDKLVIEEQVRRELSRCTRGILAEDIERYTALICSSAKRLFTILICDTMGERHALALLFALLNEGISDSDLPFAQVPLKLPFDCQDPYKLGRRQHFQCPSSDHTECSIASLANLPLGFVKRIHSGQWYATVPVFERKSGEIPHYIFEFGTMLPYVEDPIPAFKIAPGGYGEVRGVRIQPSHQNLVKSDDPLKGPILAIKELHERDPEAFQREVSMLTSLTIQYDHAHIVKLLATYEYQAKYHLVFPCAQGNLRAFWTSHKGDNWSFATCTWMLQQLSGLASALYAIHEFRTGLLVPLEPDAPNRGATDARPSRKGQLLSLVPGEEKFGRHGDIKPENILLMRRSDSLGTLQLADMGLARFHRLDSRSKVDPRTINGSASYVPPELALKIMVSRKYDIWSLGCVFLEFITWILEGHQALEQFPDERQELAYDGAYDDTFFSIVGSGPESQPLLRPKVKAWIDNLKKSRRCTPAYTALLELVEQKMLNVNVKNRISAEELHSNLQIILAQSYSDAAYLWK